MKKFAITISAVVALTGCATGPTPLDRLQSAAYQQVVLYASESQMFLDSGKSQDEPQSKRSGSDSAQPERSSLLLSFAMFG